MSKKDSVSTFILNTFIAFLLSVFITMACYIAGLKLGVFNKSLIINSMDNSEYYESIIDNTLENVQPLATPMGLDESIFDDVFTLDETSTQCKAYLTASLNGQAYTPDVSAMKERLTSNINSYLANRNLTATDEQLANIGKFADLIGDDYSEYLDVPYINYIFKYSKMFNQFAMIGIILMLVLSAFSIFLLVKLNKWWHRGLRFASYATIASAIMTIGFPAYMRITRPYSKFSIKPDYYKNLIVKYVDSSLMTFVYIGLLMCVISAIIIFIIQYKRNTLKTQAHSHRHHRDVE